MTPNAMAAVHRVTANNCKMQFSCSIRFSYIKYKKLFRFNIFWCFFVNVCNITNCSHAWPKNENNKKIYFYKKLYVKYISNMFLVKIYIIKIVISGIKVLLWKHPFCCKLVLKYEHFLLFNKYFNICYFRFNFLRFIL